jgi:hypothetical protein
MKLVKIMDLGIQAALLLYGAIYSLILYPGRSIAIYFFVGAGQVLSYLVHSFLVYSWVRVKQRKQFGQTLLGLLIIGVLCLLLVWLDFPLIPFYLTTLLIVSPFLVIWYFIIGTRELSGIYKRELIHLK